MGSTAPFAFPLPHWAKNAALKRVACRLFKSVYRDQAVWTMLTGGVAYAQTCVWPVAYAVRAWIFGSPPDLDIVAMRLFSGLLDARPAVIELL